MPTVSPLRSNVDPLPEELPNGISAIAAEMATRIAADPALVVALSNIVLPLISAEDFQALLVAEITNRLNEDVTLVVRASIRELFNNPDLNGPYYTALGTAILGSLPASPPAAPGLSPRTPPGAPGASPASPA